MKTGMGQTEMAAKDGHLTKETCKFFALNQGEKKERLTSAYFDHHLHCWDGKHHKPMSCDSY